MWLGSGRKEGKIGSMVRVSGDEISRGWLVHRNPIPVSVIEQSGVSDRWFRSGMRTAVRGGSVWYGVKPPRYRLKVQYSFCLFDDQELNLY